MTKSTVRPVKATMQVEPRIHVGFDMSPSSSSVKARLPIWEVRLLVGGYIVLSRTLTLKTAPNDAPLLDQPFPIICKAVAALCSLFSLSNTRHAVSSPSSRDSPIHSDCSINTNPSITIWLCSTESSMSCLASCASSFGHFEPGSSISCQQKP